MGSYLADTNLLLRLADPDSEQHPVATQALARLLGQGDEVYITPQNFIQFWAVATHPVEANGLRMDHRAHGQRSVGFAAAFSGAQDSPEVFTRWLELVKRLPVYGKRVHDARLVAVLQAYAVEHLVTFNISDFAAFSFLLLVDPRSLLNTPEL